MQTNELFFTLQEQYGMKYYQMPKVFFTNERYKSLSNDAKISYALLLDRLQLSIKNKWIDSSDSLYFVYTNKNLAEILNISPRKVTTVKKELMDAKLLKQEQKGFNAPFRLYLMKPEITVDDIYQITQAETGTDITPPSGKDEQGVPEKGTSPSNTPAEDASVANFASLEKGAPQKGKTSVANSATLEETASNQPSHSVANFASPVSQNLLPNKTYIINTNYKDHKEYKDQRSADFDPNQEFNQAFQEAPKETDGFMIQEFVKGKLLVERYGQVFVDTLLRYCREDYQLFRETINAIKYATKSAEKEAGKTIDIHFFADMSPYAEELQEEYFATLYRVLHQIRTNRKIENPKGFFFVSFKNLAKEWIEIIQDHEERENLDSTHPRVPLFDFVDGE